MQNLAPAGLKIALDVVLLGSANGLVGADFGIIEQGLENFVRALATIERIDHRLHDRDCTVIGAGIGPRLEIMRSGDMPMREMAGLVVVRAEMRNDLRFGKGVGEAEVFGSGINRVGIQDDEPVNLAGIEVGDEFLEVTVLIAGQGDRGIGRDGDGFADVTECLIDVERKSGDRFILIKTGNDSALAVASLEVLREGGEKLLLICGPVVLRSGCAGCADGSGERGGKCWNFAGAEAEAMLGFHARCRRRALDGVEPVHAIGGIFAAPGVIGDELVEAGIRRAGEEVGVERDDDVGAAEVVLDVVALFKKRAGDGGIVLHQASPWGKRPARLSTGGPALAM